MISVNQRCGKKMGGTAHAAPPIKLTGNDPVSSLLAGRVTAGSHRSRRGGGGFLRLAGAQREAGGGDGEEEKSSVFHDRSIGGLWLLGPASSGWTATEIVRGSVISSGFLTFLSAGDPPLR